MLPDLGVGQGVLHTRLHGTDVLDLKHLLRVSRSDGDVRQEAVRVLQHWYWNGYEVE